MSNKFDNTLLHYRSDGTYVYSTEEEIEALRDGDYASYTPSLTFGGGSTGMTYSVQTGTYVRIGRAVYYHGHITLTAKGSSTGNAFISSPTSTRNDSGHGTFVAYTGMASMDSPHLSGTIEGIIRIRNHGATLHSDCTDANFTNASDFYFSGWYLEA